LQRERNDAIRRKSMFNIIEHATRFKADFILLRNNAFQQLQFSRRIKVELLDTEACVISGEDLILSKLLWIQQLRNNCRADGRWRIFKPSQNFLTLTGTLSITGLPN
jgi:hypothetical protein